MSQQPDVVVVGGGVAGLAAAFRLRQGGRSVTVLETTGAVGGKSAAHRHLGFVSNSGAQMFPTAYAATVALARDAGLESQLEPFVPRLGILRDGRVHALRGAGLGAAADWLRSDLVPWRSKVRLLRLVIDAARRWRDMSYADHDGRARWDTESLGAYADRRLDTELREYVLDPLMRGLYLVDAQALSAVEFFFIAKYLLGSRMLRYPAGYDFLCRALAEQIGDVRLNATATAVVEAADGSGVDIAWRDADGATQAFKGVPAVVVAVPAPAVSLRKRSSTPCTSGSTSHPRWTSSRSPFRGANSTASAALRSTSRASATARPTAAA
jgi:protoporphyrinogen/coproporphyrinogen III oxidase